MRVVDAHFHVWDTTQHPYTWLDAAGMEDIPRPFRIEDYLQGATDPAPIATVHVEAEMDHNVDPVVETSALAEIRQATGHPSAAIGRVDLAAPDVADVLDRHRAYGFVRGVRQHVFYTPEHYPTFADHPGLMADATWRRGYRLLADRDLLFELVFAHSQLDEALALLHDFPDIPVVLEHALFATWWPDFASWREGITRLADAEQTVMKISGFGQFGLTSADAIRPYVDTALDVFGVARVMFGSNMPVDRMSTNWQDEWHNYADAASSLHEDESEAAFVGNALRIYRIVK